MLELQIGICPVHMPCPDANILPNMKIKTDLFVPAEKNPTRLILLLFRLKYECQGISTSFWIKHVAVGMIMTQLHFSTWVGSSYLTCSELHSCFSASRAEILTPAQLSSFRPHQVFKASAGGGTFRCVLVARAADVAHVGPNRKEINPLVRLGQGSKPQPCRGGTAPWQSRKAGLKELPARRHAK